MATGQNRRGGSRVELSNDELQQRWNDDWAKWRIREAEFKSQISTLKKRAKPVKPVKAPQKTQWERLVELSGYLSAGTMPIVLAVYAYWNAAGYPDPGRRFWTDDSVHTILQWGVPTVFAVALLKPALSWALIIIAGALMFAYMFKGY